MTLSTTQPPPPRIGIDLGGTKIAAVALGAGNEVLSNKRISTPANDYDAIVKTLVKLIHEIDHDLQIHSLKTESTIGIGMPGSISKTTGLVQNSNSTCLNGRPFAQDVIATVGRPVRFANDANCFALSEAMDGAAKGASSVFGVIIGTGCGGGIVINGQIIDGPRGIGGEWGHNPLPWPTPGEYPGPQCWCGKQGCMETWVSGPALSSDHFNITGKRLSAAEITQKSSAGDLTAKASLERYTARLARGLASVINMIDPDVIILGGGLSHIKALYQTLPDAIAPYIFSDTKSVCIRPPLHGDASGVRGAAWLWQEK